MKIITSNGYTQSFFKFAQMMGDLENRKPDTIFKVVSDYVKHQRFMEYAAQGRLDVEYAKKIVVSDVAQFFAVHDIQDKSERTAFWNTLRQTVNQVIDSIVSQAQVSPVPRSL